MMLQDEDEKSGEGSTLIEVPLSIDKALEKVVQRNKIGYIVINEDIDEETCLNFEKQFRLCEAMPTDTILISIHSCGGCVYSGLRMIDLMNNSLKTIITVCSGCCMARLPSFSQGIWYMSSRDHHDTRRQHWNGGGNLQDVETEAGIRRLGEGYHDVHQYR